MEKNKKVRENKTKPKDSDTLLNHAIDKLPIELHVPGYRFCGPGTHLQKRLEKGQTGINPLDEACRLHDIAYADKQNKSSRAAADRELVRKALSRIMAQDASLSEKSVALLTCGCMLCKIAIDKYCKKIKNALRRVVKELKPEKTGNKSKVYNIEFEITSLYGNIIKVVAQCSEHDFQEIKEIIDSKDV